MDPNQIAGIPFYLDWKFWSFAVAGLAVVLSQLPPISKMIRRAKLVVEAYDYIALTHKAGNPNVQLHLMLTNAGGSSIKVKDITLLFQRADKTISLPAKNYLMQPNDAHVKLLTPTTLKPDEQWEHVVNFLNYFSKEDERQYRQLRFNLRNDIVAKRKALLDNDKQNVAADDANVAPLIAFYEKRFVWDPGEYRVTLRVNAEPAKLTVERKYRFTVFESDSQLLRDHSKGYAYGGGILFNADDHESVINPLIQE